MLQTQGPAPGTCPTGMAGCSPGGGPCTNQGLLSEPLLPQVNAALGIVALRASLGGRKAAPHPKKQDTQVHTCGRLWRGCGTAHSGSQEALRAVAARSPLLRSAHAPPLL